MRLIAVKEGLRLPVVKWQALGAEDSEDAPLSGIDVCLSHRQAEVIVAQVVGG